MGISFHPTDPAEREFTFLRGYRVPCDAQATQADTETARASTWQGEDSDQQQTISLDRILGASGSNIIGLFGLDEQTAKAARRALSRRPNVIDLSPRSRRDEFAPELSDGDGILRRLSDLCGLKTTTDAALETLRHMLEWTPPLVFVLDATDSITIEQRTRLCQAAGSFMDAFNTSGGKAHCCVVLMTHRYHFDGQSGRVDAYLPQAAAWFRTETTLPDMPLGEQYLIRDRAQAVQRGGSHSAFFGFKPVERSWAYDRLCDGFNQTGGSLQFITGLAGAGKSTVMLRMANMAELNDGHTLICDCGFNRLRGETNMLAMLKQLCARLMHGLGWDYRLPNAQDDARLHGYDDVESSRTFAWLLLRAASDWVANPATFHAIEPEHPRSARRAQLRRIVIAIDALDEADPGQQKCTPNWLINQCIQDPRAGIHVICTARNDKPFHPRGATFGLDDPDMVSRDLQELVDVNAPWLTNPQRKQVLTVGKGNFLATALVLHYLHAHSPSGPSDELDELIRKIEADTKGAGDIFVPIYDLFWLRFVSDERDQDRKLAAEVIADLLCVAPAPLPPAMIHEVCEKHYRLDDWHVIQPVCDDMATDGLLVVDVDGHYAPYHDTFRDYLQAVRRGGAAALRYRRTCQHAAAWCYGRVQNWLATSASLASQTAEDGYALRHVMHHLREADAWEPLHTLLTAPRFLIEALKENEYEASAAWAALEHNTCYRPIDAYRNIDIDVGNVDEVSEICGFLQDMGHMGEAEEMYRKTLAINEKLGCQEDIAANYGNLGILCCERGDLEQAEEMYRKALEINRKLGRQGGIAANYSSLGTLCCERDDLHQAETMYRKALEIYEKRGLQEGVAVNYGNLGLLYRKLGKLDRAEEMYRKSLAIFEKLGRQEGIASNYHNLGILYCDHGDLAQAEKMYRKALAINVKIGRQVSAARNSRKIGSLCHKRGDREQAEEMYRKSLAIYERLGLQENVAGTYKDLGKLCSDHGELDQAEKMHRKSLAICEKLDLQVGIADNYGSLGKLCYIRGELDRAETLYHESLAMCEKLGLQEGVADNCACLGVVYHKRDDLKQAEELYRKSLAIREKLGGQMDVACICSKLGDLCTDRGKPDQAEEMYRKVLAICEKLGLQEGVAYNYGKLGKLLCRDRDKLDQAETMYRKALEIYEKRGLQEGVTYTCVSLGILCHKRDDLKQAEELYRKSLAIDERLGLQEGVAANCFRLGTICHKREEWDEANKMYRESLAICEKLGLQEGIADNCGNLGILYRDRGDLGRARKYWIRARGLFVQMGASHMVAELQGRLDSLGDPGAATGS